jgi:3-deoxy-D-manno-octulosonate 8-phosphate phosphatase (KDO 8-P phosphatase)
MYLHLKPEEDINSKNSIFTSIKANETLVLFHSFFIAKIYLIIQTMSFLEKLHDISCFIFDVDGVLTDGSVHVQEDGSLLRTMNIKDGYAIRHAVDKGYAIFIITGGKSTGVQSRLVNLGIPKENIFMAVQEKGKLMSELLKSKKIDPEKAVYMGDDIPDYAPMRLVNLPCCPKDAVPEVKAVSQYVSAFDGGKGCVRDILEKVMRVQGNWNVLDPVNF